MAQIKMSVAFRKARISNPGDCFIAAACRSSIVHVELRMNDVSFSSYSDCKVPAFRPACVSNDDENWIVIPLPIVQYQEAYTFLMQMYNSNLEYGAYWQCAIPQVCLRMVEDDLDYENPASWKSVFCSESVLLFLKRCYMHNMMPETWKCIMDVISRGCSPIRLYGIVMKIQSSTATCENLNNCSGFHMKGNIYNSISDSTTSVPSMSDVPFCDVKALFRQLQCLDKQISNLQHHINAAQTYTCQPHIQAINIERYALYRALTSLLQDEQYQLHQI